jgi:Tfp pilus assembly protein PilF
MRNVSVRPRRSVTIGRSLALTAVLALGVTACSDDAKSSDSSSSTQPDATKAKQALDAGLKAHADGDLTAASTKYGETLTYDPKNKFAHYNLALIDEASGNYGLAEEKYRKALETDPKYEPALFNLAILRTSGDPEEAIGLYQRAVKSAPKDAAAWLNLGLLLRASGDEAEGDEAVLKAIELNPDLVDPAE